MKKMVGILLGLGLACAANASIIVDYEHTAGSTNPVSTATGVTSTSALGGTIAGGVIATTIDQLSYSPGINLGAENYNNYFVYTVVNSTNVTFSSLDLDATAKQSTRNFRVSYTVGTGTETFITEWASVPRLITDTAATVNYDFTDFTTTEDVEFRVYWAGTATKTSEARVYVDDFVLNGAVIPEPAAVGLLGLGGLITLLISRFKRR
jgi:hypothetical protein